MHALRIPHLPLIGALLLGVGPAVAAPSEIVPGITYERVVDNDQVTHVTRVSQGPLVSIRPERITGEVDTRGLLTRAMSARARGGALIGVNGDYFNWENGYPSGVLMLGGELVHEPEATRSGLAFLSSGRLASVKSALAGEWTTQDPATGVLNDFGFIGVNRPAERDAETILYTPRYGDPTPTGNRADAIIALDAQAPLTPNRDLYGVVESVTGGGGVVAPPGKVVLAGVGDGPRSRVEAFAKPGWRVRVKAAIPDLPADLVDAIGGGPLLVSGGQPVTSAGEGFTSGQIGSRTARTAIGQTASGQVLLVVSEGPAEGSPGLTTAQQAAQLAALGAQTAVAMDSGGSSAMALRGQILNRQAAGERRLSNAIIVRYAGVQLTDPAPLISPNGDGVRERTGAYARAGTQGTVNITLNRAGGRAVKLLYRGGLGTSARTLSLSGRTIRVPDGAYTIVAKFRPADGSTPSSTSRRVIVDRTLGAVKVAKTGTGAKAKLRVRYRLSHAARVTITIRRADGSVVTTLQSRRRVGGGARAATWNMKVKGTHLPPGVYTVAITTRADQANTIAKRFRMAKIDPPASTP